MPLFTATKGRRERETQSTKLKKGKKFWACRKTRVLFFWSPREKVLQNTIFFLSHADTLKVSKFDLLCLHESVSCVGLTSIIFVRRPETQWKYGQNNLGRDRTISLETPSGRRSKVKGIELTCACMTQMRAYARDASSSLRWRNFPAHLSCLVKGGCNFALLYDGVSFFLHELFSSGNFIIEETRFLHCGFTLPV